jgi:hypothetical protein
MRLSNGIAIDRKQHSHHKHIFTLAATVSTAELEKILKILTLQLS